MRAFILRRVALLAGGHGDAVVMGSPHSAATLRLQAFLTRNAHPFRFVDVTEPRRPVFARRVPRRRSPTYPYSSAVVSACSRTPPTRWWPSASGSTWRSNTAPCTTDDLRARARRTRRRSVRGVGGPRRPRPRDERSGRPGRIELEDRELPRLPDGHLRAGARGARARSGREVRCEARASPGRGAHSMRASRRFASS